MPWESGKLFQAPVSRCRASSSRCIAISLIPVCIRALPTCYANGAWMRNSRASTKSSRVNLGGAAAGMSPRRRSPWRSSMSPKIVGPQYPRTDCCAHRFAIATIETPLALFQKFDAGHAKQRVEAYGESPVTPPDAPADVLSYFDAARFCNWLSEQEGIPPAEWCYRNGAHAGEMILDPNYATRRGYRLPTLPEWELAAHAGTTSARYFGQETTFSDYYAWHKLNADGHTHPVGRLRPNDFGLFDVLGNTKEWCHNPKLVLGQCTCCPPGSEPEHREIRAEALKGGYFLWEPRDQSVSRSRIGHSFELADPDFRYVFAGFRVVKNGF